MEDTGSYYLIRHLVLLTGLTDRTIRKYISSGILQGERINGLWHFTPEQMESFIRHPAVHPRILAKHHAAVYDFLLDDRKQANEICVILDCPGKNQKEMAEFFCYRISNGDFQKIHFSFDFDDAANTPRVTLTGDAAGVLRLVNGFMAEKGAD